MFVPLMHLQFRKIWGEGGVGLGDGGMGGDGIGGGGIGGGGSS